MFELVASGMAWALLSPECFGEKEVLHVDDDQCRFCWINRDGCRRRSQVQPGCYWRRVWGRRVCQVETVLPGGMEPEVVCIAYH